MKDGFIKIACATPDVRVADCDYNAEQIISLTKEAAANGAKLIAFPELSITGYTCGDLFFQKTLLDGAMNALKKILKETAELDIVVIAGLPWSYNGVLYNCAAVCSQGRILGMVPKTNITDHGGAYESKYFTDGNREHDIWEDVFFSDDDYHLSVTVKPEIVFSCESIPDFRFGVEICQDVQAVLSPSSRMAVKGASLIVNIACMKELVGSADSRQTFLKAKSESLICAYAFANAGIGESTQDYVFAGRNMILENGKLLAEAKPFESGIIYSDIDVQAITAERRKSSTFPVIAYNDGVHVFDVEITETNLTRHISKSPFIPEDKAELAKRCEEILTMQAAGLATRLRHINCKNAVVGLSGGLDSTLALIVIAHAFDMLGLDRSGILAVTMPCFGTTDRTYNNACKLAKSYGAELREVRIADSVLQHFKDIGHDPDARNVTYENAQARERTQVLMDLANEVNGLVIGTGDLSELALGWATYNGDHMSMYGVNASIPKTLVRHLTAFEAERSEGVLREVLFDVLDTPVSPELLPPEKDGTIAQKTEDLVGPYELHDFILYYVVRHGFSPKKIYRLACIAFDGVYDKETILKWLRKFYWRFFSQQFKRSCLPDGVAVGSVGLSPRGGWQMPSDAWVTLWQREIDEIDG